MLFRSASSYSTITIDSTTGAISTTANTIPGNYTIYVYNTGSYNITSYVLSVTAVLTNLPLTETAICCSIPINFTGADYTMANNAVSGNTIIGNYNKRPLKQPIDYCFMYQMSQAAAMKQRR